MDQSVRQLLLFFSIQFVVKFLDNFQIPMDDRVESIFLQGLAQIFQFFDLGSKNIRTVDVSANFNDKSQQIEPLLVIALADTHVKQIQAFVVFQHPHVQEATSCDSNVLVLVEDGLFNPVKRHLGLSQLQRERWL